VFIVANGTAGAAAQSAAAGAYTEIARVLAAENLAIGQERVFASVDAQPSVLSARNAALAECAVPTDAPVTCIEGHPTWGVGWAGTIIHAIPCDELDEPVTTIRAGTRPVGRRWRRGGATYVVLQALPHAYAIPAGSRGAVVQRAIAEAEGLLQAQGVTYRDVVRTWFYVTDILSWYDEFNAARNAEYCRLGVWPASEHGTSLPASTGIAGRRADGQVCSLDLLAIAPGPSSAVTLNQLGSPRQCEASCYGSAFARGVVIRRPDSSLIEVSGTAAVDEEGNSRCAGDVAAQVRQTLQNVEALLAQENAGLQNLSAATAFVKNPEDAGEVARLLEECGLSSVPVVTVIADICREELLFELDAEVVVPC
jgi:enamine deaminase RidA (YjgF/YER057c/UK114 family)